MSKPMALMKHFGVAVLLITFSNIVNGQDSRGNGDAQTRTAAVAALAKAVAFYADQVAVEGGYVYQVSADLRYREGEGDAGQKMVWVQPPATPAVGEAFLQAYLLTKNEECLKAAKSAADCLIRGQLHSGGWANYISFDPETRNELAYRIDGPARKKARNVTSFDDDQTQSAIRFLSRLDQALQFKDSRIHEATLFALKAVLSSQYPCGAWPQGFRAPYDASKHPVLKASYPSEWSREYRKSDYWDYYTLNDNAMVSIAESMLLAAHVYNNEEYLNAAKKAGDFLLSAVMPAPQPAWAQQYNFQMQPAWARKFEPPAISGYESQNVIRYLMQLYATTGEEKYLEPVEPALAYLEKSVLPNNKLARFYELRTNKPLYFDKEYRLTYDDSDMPTHYGFVVENGLPKLRKSYNEIRALDTSKRAAYAASFYEFKKSKPTSDQVLKVINSMDSRGAWVESGKLKYVKTKDAVDQVIRSETFIENLNLLAQFVAATPAN